MLDIKAIRAEVQRQLRDEGIKAIIKHEVEEVVWSVLSTAIDDALEKFKDELVKKIPSQKLDELLRSEWLRKKVRQDVEKQLRGYEFYDKIRKAIDKHIDTIAHQKAVEISDKVQAGEWAEIRKEVARRAKAFLEADISELIKQQLGLVYDAQRRMEERLLSLESRVTHLETR